MAESPSPEVMPSLIRPGGRSRFLLGIGLCALAILLAVGLMVGDVIGFNLLTAGAYVWLVFGQAVLIALELLCLGILIAGKELIDKATR